MADRLHELVAEHLPLSKALPGDPGGRTAAREALQNTTLPGRADERWRYTRLRQYLAQRFAPAPEPALEASRQQVARIAAAVEPAALVVLDNGRYHPQLSRIDSADERLRVHPLADWLGRGGTLSARKNESVFELLNTAFVADGAVIEVAADARIGRPVVVLYLNGTGAAGTAMHSRLQIDCASGAEVSLLELQMGAVGAPSFATGVTQIGVGPGGMAHHVRVLAEDDAAVRFHYLRLNQQQNSRVDSRLFMVGAGLGRQEVECRGLGDGAHVDLRALLLGQNDQQLELYADFLHGAPNGSSQLDCKTMVNDHARAVFNGRVLVEPGADGSDARVNNANLLLSPDAEVDTKPELEIYADDVRCSHGATVGELDEQQIYYLCSRGFTPLQARRLLLGAFAGELIASVTDERSRGQVDALVRQALAQLEESA